MAGWPFEDAPDTPAVTTVHVTSRRLPILHACHALDEDGMSTWQFHCETVPFAMDAAQLVRLDTIVGIDPTVLQIAGLPIGHSATRDAVGAPWRIENEE
jgi:hypothetical protein